MHFSLQDLKSNTHMYGAAAGLSFVELTKLNHNS